MIPKQIIRITRETFIEGERFAYGTIVEVKADIARQLIAMHKAERITEEEAAAAEAESQAAPAPAPAEAPAKPAPAKK